MVDRVSIMKFNFQNNLTYMNLAKQKRCAMKAPFVEKTCQCSTADRDPPIKRPPLCTLVNRVLKNVLLVHSGLNCMQLACLTDP